MLRATLLMSLVLIASSSAAIAATPIFQLHRPHAEAQSLAIDTNPSTPEPASAIHKLRAPYASAVSVTPTMMNTVYNTVPDSDANSGSGDSGAAAQRTAGLNASNDSLFYFLKNFRARPLQKPENGTLLLVGLCFVLYQIRRRPMRASIGFQTTAGLIGR